MRLRILAPIAVVLAFLFGLVGARQDRDWAAPHFCLTGSQRLDEDMARYFIVQYFLIRARFANDQGPTQGEAMSWRPWSFDLEPVTDGLSPYELGWSVVAKSNVAERDIGLRVDDTCRYDLYYSAQKLN